MNHIELFAGCGGLNLGLTAAGFSLLFANELSPMASETFAYNFFDEDLEKIAMHQEKADAPSRTRWLSSKFTSSMLKDRLRENPHEYPAPGSADSKCDLENASDFYGNLIVGDIRHLNAWLDQRPQISEKLRDGLGDGGVDLVSGGPPCQSFSMAGMRQYSNARNRLPEEFAHFVEKVQPKYVLLENVTGILRPFTVDGEKVYAWFEVAQLFSSIGYIPLCLHVNAKNAGVAQHRPRFIMIGIREDVLLVSRPALEELCNWDELFGKSTTFYERIQAGESVDRNMLPCFDVASPKHAAVFGSALLRPLSRCSDGDFQTVSEAIADLKMRRPASSNYVDEINTLLGKPIEKYREFPGEGSLPLNSQPRANKPLVKRRFRIYQILAKIGSSELFSAVKSVLAGRADFLAINKRLSAQLLEHRFLMENGTLRILSGEAELVSYLKLHRTKKQSQRALAQDAPAPAALSIPDDACHYLCDDDKDWHALEDLRTLTVREMARIQSFPDNFVFKSKITTGSHMRKYEVPQYTQVGNAVPPLLGYALGVVLNSLDKCHSLGLRSLHGQRDTLGEINKRVAEVA